MTSQLNPKTTTFEFGGLIGALGISLGLPLFTIFLNQLCRPDYYIVGMFRNFEISQLLNGLRPLESYFKFSDLWFYYSIWFFTLVVLAVVLPGRKMYGVQLRDGTKLEYKINGISIVFVILSFIGIRFFYTDGKLPELQYLYDNHVHLCIITILFSFDISVYCYIVSFIPLLFGKNGKGGKEKILAVGGNSNNPIYNWFIGRELNPRIGPIDIKMFCELRPGMLLWFLINLSCLHHHYISNNHEINDALLLVNILQGFYIFDGVLNEEGVLSMMDITTDGFGFMLAFGDLTLVPFSYSLQARYLSINPIELGYFKISIIVSVMIIGYYIFHSSNKQKSDFKQGKLPNLKSIKTKRGTKLLCDGWWAKSQHMNYFGDWLISLSWCMTTWTVTPLTYYYCLYFATLLLHRQQRDEHKCRLKYGDSWEEYEKSVPYKIVPYVY